MIIRHISLLAFALLVIAFLQNARAHRSIDEQIDATSKKIEQSHENLELRIRRANLYLEMGYKDLARIDIDFVLAAEPEQPQALLALSRLEREAKNYKEAGRAIDEFLNELPSQPQALKERALNLTQARQWGQASEAWLTYLNLVKFPDSDSFLMCFETMLKGSRDGVIQKKAIEVIREGLKIHPNEISLNQRMASIFIRVGDLESARKQFISIHRKYPSLSPRLHADEARMWQAEGNRILALEAYVRAHKSFDSLPLSKIRMPGFQALKEEIEKGMEINR